MIGFGPLDRPFVVLAGKVAGEHINAFDIAITTTRPLLVSKEIEILQRFGHIRQTGTTDYEVVSIPWQNRERKPRTPAQ